MSFNIQINGKSTFFAREQIAWGDGNLYYSSIPSPAARPVQHSPWVDREAEAWGSYIAPPRQAPAQDNPPPAEAAASPTITMQKMG